MTAIKICGITQEQDAAVAVALGVHALGFVWWPDSPRYVELSVVTRIVATLPPFVTPVGVFVSPATDHIAQAARAGIRVAQIHGNVPAWPVGGESITLLRAVHLDPGSGAAIEPEVPAGEAVHLDANDPVRHGGTGQPIDWFRAKEVAAARRIVLAGGLTPANVSDAIRIVRPYAVDVSSGVEWKPGIKDHGLLREFVQAVKETV